MKIYVIVVCKLTISMTGERNIKMLPGKYFPECLCFLLFELIYYFLMQTVSLTVHFSFQKGSEW